MYDNREYDEEIVVATPSHEALRNIERHMRSVGAHEVASAAFRDIHTIGAPPPGESSVMPSATGFAALPEELQEHILLDILDVTSLFAGVQMDRAAGGHVGAYERGVLEGLTTLQTTYNAILQGAMTKVARTIVLSSRFRLLLYRRWYVMNPSTRKPDAFVTSVHQYQVPPIDPVRDTYAGVHKTVDTIHPHDTLVARWYGRLLYSAVIGDYFFRIAEIVTNMERLSSRKWALIYDLYEGLITSGGELHTDTLVRLFDPEHFGERQFAEEKLEDGFRALLSSGGPVLGAMEVAFDDRFVVASPLGDEDFPGHQLLLSIFSRPKTLRRRVRRLFSYKPWYLRTNEFPVLKYYVVIAAGIARGKSDALGRISPAGADVFRVPSIVSGSKRRTPPDRWPQGVHKQVLISITGNGINQVLLNERLEPRSEEAGESNVDVLRERLAQREREDRGEPEPAPSRPRKVYMSPVRTRFNAPAITFMMLRNLLIANKEQTNIWITDTLKAWLRGVRREQVSADGTAPVYLDLVGVYLPRNPRYRHREPPVMDLPIATGRRRPKPRINTHTLEQLTLDPTPAPTPPSSMTLTTGAGRATDWYHITTVELVIP